MTMLNHQLIGTLRHTRGYSQRQVADQLGVNSNLVAAIEEGTNHADLPVRILTRLADLLGVPAGRLFDDHPTEADGDEELVRKVGAILLTVDGQVRIETIAEICDVDLIAVREAIDTLKAKIRALGGAVAETDEGVRLYPDQQTVDQDVVAATVRWVHARHGMTPTEARILDEHRRGALRTQHFDANDHIAYARLMNAGLIAVAGQSGGSTD